VTPPPTAEAPNPQPKPGAIKSAACFAWDSCWFFGTYGAVVHWDGHALIDASPDRSAGSLQAEITAAVAHRDPSGNPVGAAVAGTSEQFESAPLATQSDQAPPAELYGSSGGAFSPLPFTPFTAGQPQDPYRTDLVAVDLGPDGQGWVAGNPAGLRLHEREGLPPPVEKDQEPPLARQFSSPSPQPSPIQPVATTGVPTACTGPPSTRFTYTAVPKETKATAQEGAFLWSSLAVLPGAGEALAGGRMRRAPASAGKGNEDARIGEPVIAAAACDGTTTVTRFRIPDPLNPSQSAPADRGGSVTALAANASNDAWAATTTGRLESPDGIFFNGVPERPNVYRLTDGQPPASPEGNDEEFRPREEKLDAPIFVLEPPPPPEPPPSPAPVTQTHTETLPPAVYAVKVKVHATRRHGHLTLSLYLTFKVRRPTTIGAEALRRGRVVSVARPRHFTAGRGLLILNLDRRRWPTKVSFLA
jgi:hypothetical protein